jgi:hypothetical protein
MGNTPQQVLTWSSGLAIILFCLTGVASMLGWIPAPVGRPADAPERQTTTSSNRVLAPGECHNCGVISTTCILDVADEAPFMAGLVNVSGVLGVGLVETVSGAPAPAADHASGRHYQTTVRFNNGTTRAFADDADQKWKVGDRVRVNRGVILPQG